MRHRLTALLGAFTFLAFASASAQDLATLSTPLETPTGTKTSVADLGKGKVTIISFWATWCTPCKEEMKAVDPIYNEWKGDDLAVEYIAVSIDNTKSMAKVGPFIKAKGYAFPVLLDPNSELFQDVNGTEVPYTLIYDATGKLRYKHDGYLEGDEERLKEEVMGLLEEANGSTGTEESAG